MVALARPGVQGAGDAGAILLSDGGHARALREILAHQAVGVLVGSPLPCVMRRGEVDGGAGRLLDAREIVELGAVVRGDGVHWLPLVADERDDPPGHLGRGPGPELPEHHD